MKKTLLAQNLDCDSCSAKLAAGVGKMEGVKLSAFDFPVRKLYLEVDDDKMDGIVEKASAMLEELHPGGTLIPLVKKTMQINDLHCPDCAAKLAGKIGMLDGVKSALLNFPEDKMELEAEESKLEVIMKSASEIATELHPESTFSVL